MMQRNSPQSALVLTLTLALALVVVPLPAHGREVQIQPGSGWASQLNALLPGDVALLGSGRYTGGGRLVVKGTLGNPIIVRGAPGHLSIFDGEARSSQALELNGVSDLVFENIVVTNPSSSGFDGRDDYTPVSRNYLDAGDPRYSRHHEGIVITNSLRVTIQKSVFRDIATRGILAMGTGEDLRVLNNIFIRVGDDTASGDINLNAGKNWLIQGNLFAGNVDGVVTEGAIQGGGLIERNLFVFHKWENQMDFKSHNQQPRMMVRANVLYCQSQVYGPGVTSHAGGSGVTDNISFHGNAIHGTGRGVSLGKAAFTIYGRCLYQGCTDSDPAENFEIIGNWFDSFGEGGVAIATARAWSSGFPARIRNVTILHNVFQGYDAGIELFWGDGVVISNNIFSQAPIRVTGATNVDGGTNLFDRTSTWGSRPLQGTPAYANPALPVGRLAPGSVGTGAATQLPGQPWGDDVGLPPGMAGIALLESEILCGLERHFTVGQIREAMQQGDVPYQPGAQCASGGDGGVRDGGGGGAVDSGVDAGRPNDVDGGADSGFDAGLSGGLDGGVDDPNPREPPVGCGCAASGAVGASWLLLLLFGAFVRRKRA